MHPAEVHAVDQPALNPDRHAGIERETLKPFGKAVAYNAIT